MATYLVWKYSDLISDERMTMIDLPKSIVFYTVVVAFALMCVRSIQVMIEDMRRGYSVPDKSRSLHAGRRMTP